MKEKAGEAEAPRVEMTDVAIPPPDISFRQDEEWCVVRADGGWKKIRFHDYERIYEVAGLYETIFYDVLKCCSPETIRRLLASALEEAGADPDALRVLDLGAGNGMVAEELAKLGDLHFVGVDIIEAAEAAAKRDRNGLYDDYVVADMTSPSDAVRRRLEGHELNALTCIAALGFGDIPTEAFVTAFNLVNDGGWIAFNIKDSFLADRDRTGFAELVRTMTEDGTLKVWRRESYPHRLATSGEPLRYTAFVATKQRDLQPGSS